MSDPAQFDPVAMDQQREAEVPTLPVPLSCLVDRLRVMAPDRELDTAIWLSVVPGTTRSVSRFVHVASGRPQVLDETRLLQPDGARRLVNVPRYTESIDAAVTLIPAGYVWECGFSRFVPHNASVCSSVAAHGCFVGECDGSRAIAICIAAIKAIAATQGEIIP